MIKEIQKIFKISIAGIASIFLLYSCESDADQLGLQFFQNGIAHGTEKNYDVIAYNVNHNDSIQSDNDRLMEATLGAFDEPNFGFQKSSYVTQVRLLTYNPDFGVNPVVDSVVLQIKPQYQTATDSIKTTTDENYIYPDGNVPAKKVITAYPIKKYGKYKINGVAPTFTINVNEVTEFLNSTQTNFYSNKQVTLGNIIGTKSFDGYLRAIKITKDADNSELLSRDATLRIPLDKTFFQNKIIAKKGSFELNDAASFIRYFKGLRISVVENDGYIFNFNPNEITTVIYYKYDKTENNVTTRPQTNFSLDLGSSNVHFNQIDYNNRTNAPNLASEIAVIDSIVGEKKLFLQGMGGPGAEIKIKQTTIDSLKTLYNSKKIAILSAKLRLYTDPVSWNNNYPKPSTFIANKKDNTTFLEDMSTFAYNGVYKLVSATDLDKNPGYYEVGITQTLKSIVEEEESNKPIVIDVGNFLTASNSGLLGVKYTSRAYTPNRVVLVGSNLTNADQNFKYRAQLKVIYSNK